MQRFEKLHKSRRKISLGVKTRWRVVYRHNAIRHALVHLHNFAPFRLHLHLASLVICRSGTLPIFPHTTSGLMQYTPKLALGQSH
jgi:hypothetical protein